VDVVKIPATSAVVDDVESEGVVELVGGTEVEVGLTVVVLDGTVLVDVVLDGTVLVDVVLDGTVLVDVVLDVGVVVLVVEVLVDVVLELVVDDVLELVLELVVVTGGVSPQNCTFEMSGVLPVPTGGSPSFENVPAVWGGA
jgi:hypothetical protein